MSTEDFYSPPSASVSDAPEPGAEDFDVISGEILTYSPLLLPTDLCIRCGSYESGGRTPTKKLYYVTPWIALAFFINILILLILFFIFRKRLNVTYYECPTCLAKRKKKLLITAGVGLGSLVASWFAFAADMFVAGPALGFGFIVALIVLVYIAQPPLRARKHKAGLFTVKGASAAFLDEVAKQRGPDRSTAVW